MNRSVSLLCDPQLTILLLVPNTPFSCHSLPYLLVIATVIPSYLIPSHLISSHPIFIYLPLLIYLKLPIITVSLLSCPLFTRALLLCVITLLWVTFIPVWFYSRKYYQYPKYYIFRGSCTLLPSRSPTDISLPFVSPLEFVSTQLSSRSLPPSLIFPLVSVIILLIKCKKSVR